MPLYSPDQIEKLSAGIFKAVGAPSDIAEHVAHSLVESNLMGHDSHGVLRIPSYLEAVENPFRKIGPEEWTVLQGMLRNPISGLSALGLALFPERLQDHFLDSIQQGGTANVRLNLEPSAVSPDRLSVLALRALCQETGAKLYVDEADAVLPASGEPQYLMSGTASWRPRPTSP